MKDLLNNIHVAPAIPPVALVDNTPKVSSIINRQGFDSLTFLIMTGNLPDADATYTVLVEDGNDAAMADAAAVVDDELLGTEALASFTFANDNACRKIGYVGNKQYVRLTITPANLAAGAELVSAVAVLGHPSLVPTANPPA